MFWHINFEPGDLTLCYFSYILCLRVCYVTALCPFCNAPDMIVTPAVPPRRHTVSTVHGDRNDMRSVVNKDTMKRSSAMPISSHKIEYAAKSDYRVVTASAQDVHENFDNARWQSEAVAKERLTSPVLKQYGKSPPQRSTIEFQSHRISQQNNLVSYYSIHTLDYLWIFSDFQNIYE